MSSGYRWLIHKLLPNTDRGNSYGSCQTHNKRDKVMTVSFRARPQAPPKDK